MSMKESAARLANSRKQVTGWVWDWEDAKHFLGAALDAGKGSSFFAVLGLDAEGNPDLHFGINMSDGTKKMMHADGVTEFNFSHPCPGNPGCPE